MGCFTALGHGRAENFSASPYIMITDISTCIFLKSFDKINVSLLILILRMEKYEQYFGDHFKKGKIIAQMQQKIMMKVL